MGAYQLSIYHAVLMTCFLIGGFVAYSVVSRIRSHRRYFEELRRWSYGMATLQEQERTRFAHDLHDHLAPLLAITRLMLHKGIRELNTTTLGKAEANICQAIDDLGHIIRNLTPRNLEEQGLRSVLESFFSHCRQLYPAAFSFDYQVATPLPPAMNIHLYRMVQEAVHNSVKHSGAAQIGVQLKERKGVLHLICRDNGCGIPAGRSGMGLGLNTLRLRTTYLCGTMQQLTPPGGGTVLLFNIPLSIPDGNN